MPARRRLAHNHEESAKAEALADAGVYRAVFGLLDLDPETAWRAGDAAYSFSVGDGDVQVWIEDEDGKIDLNAAALQLIAGLFIAVGLPEEEAQLLADRIGDFRDEDSEPEPLGAEDDAYFDAGLAQGAADRPFATESELLRVPELLAGRSAGRSWSSPPRNVRFGRRRGGAVIQAIDAANCSNSLSGRRTLPSRARARFSWGVGPPFSRQNFRHPYCFRSPISSLG